MNKVKIEELRDTIRQGYKILKQWSTDMQVDNYPFSSKTKQVVAYEVARLQLQRVEVKVNQLLAEMEGNAKP